MFRDGAGVDGAVNMKATLSVLCNNGVIPSRLAGGQTLGCPITRGLDVESALISWLGLRLLAWTKPARKLLTALSQVLYFSL